MRLRLCDTDRIVGRLSWLLVVIGAAACGNAPDDPLFSEPLGPSSTGGSPANPETGTGGNLVSAGGTSVGGGSSGGESTGGALSGGAASSGESSGGASTGGDSSVGGEPTSGGSSTGGLGGTTGGAGDTGGGGAGGEPEDLCASIDGEAVEFMGHCYLYRETQVSFPDAVAQCEERGAHLVTISSEGLTEEEFLAENDFVWALGGDVPKWIGATDGHSSSQPGDGTFFHWITDEEMILDNWSDGQPNNAQTECQDNTECSCANTSCYEHCAFMWEEVEGEWNDRLCDHLLPFVCEWDTPPT